MAFGGMLGGIAGSLLGKLTAGRRKPSMTSDDGTTLSSAAKGSQAAKRMPMQKTMKKAGSFSRGASMLGRRY